MRLVSCITFAKPHAEKLLARRDGAVATFRRCAISVRFPLLCSAHVATPRRIASAMTTMRSSKPVALLLAALLIAGCSKTPESQRAASSDAAAGSLQPLAAESADVLRAKIGRGDTAAEYAAHFEGDQLSRIVEHRHVAQATVAAEYEFKGARLLHYRGAMLTGSGEADLQFDMQGRLLSGQGPAVSEEEIRQVRGRAQLLRNHALAQRATRMHH